MTKRHANSRSQPTDLEVAQPVPHHKWACSSCGTTDYNLWYKSGLMKQCYNCQGYSNMLINSGQKARKRSGIKREVTFSQKQWQNWVKKNPRRCKYCKITDAEYFALKYPSANNKVLEALGIDRRYDGDYDLKEIDWCCYPCNRTKANSFTAREMEVHLSAGLEAIWRERLENGVTGVNYNELISQIKGGNKKSSAKKRKRKR